MLGSIIRLASSRYKNYHTKEVKFRVISIFFRKLVQCFAHKQVELCILIPLWPTKSAPLRLVTCPQLSHNSLGSA